MAYPAEIEVIHRCPDCGADIPIEVQRSTAGYYIGQWCPNCGPHSRLSGYFQRREQAEKALTSGMGVKGWEIVRELYPSEVGGS